MRLLDFLEILAKNPEKIKIELLVKKQILVKKEIVRDKNEIFDNFFYFH
mgnify:CR=1 FL=1